MLLFLLFFSFTASAVDCNNHPKPAGGRISGAWWSEYSSWCTACGGTPYQNSSGGGCNPGPNWGGAKSATATPQPGAQPMDHHIQQAVSAGMSGQISAEDATALVGMGILGNALLAQPSPAELEARRQREWEMQQAAIAAEQERQRKIKEKNDRMDAEAAGTLALLDTGKVSDEDLLKTPPRPFDCKATADKVAKYEAEGLKRLDINIGKARKVIKQAEEGKSKANRELAEIAGEAAAGKMADVMQDFVKNQKTIAAMEKQLQKLAAGNSVTNADKEKLQAWIDNGLKAGGAMIDTYETAKKAKAVDFADPKNASRKEQMLAAMEEFNNKFMNDTGAWELAGEHLSAGLGPAGPAVFKASVLGIKVAANRGAHYISENDLNEQKYHLGNMEKTRAEMAQKIKDMKKQMQQEKCKT